MKRTLLLIVSVVIIICSYRILSFVFTEKNMNELETAEHITSEVYSFNMKDIHQFDGSYSDEEMGDYQLCFMGEIKKFNEIRIGKEKIGGITYYCPGMT